MPLTTFGESWKECWTSSLNPSLLPQPLSERNRAFRGSGDCSVTVAQEVRLSVTNNLFPSSRGNLDVTASSNRVWWLSSIGNRTHAVVTERDVVLEETDEEVLADEGEFCNDDMLPTSSR